MKDLKWEHSIFGDFWRDQRVLISDPWCNWDGSLHLWCHLKREFAQDLKGGMEFSRFPFLCWRSSQEWPTQWNQLFLIVAYFFDLSAFAASPSNSPSRIELGSGLVAYYNEDGKTHNDSFRRYSTNAMQSAPTATTEILGKAYEFSGADSSLVVPLLLTLRGGFSNYFYRTYTQTHISTGAEANLKN